MSRITLSLDGDTSKEELTRGVIIMYVDDLLLTGWQHHIDAITNAVLAKYVIKYIQHCLRENKFFNEDGHVVLRKAHAPPTMTRS